MIEEILKKHERHGPLSQSRVWEAPLCELLTRRLLALEWLQGVLDQVGMGGGHWRSFYAGNILTGVALTAHTE